MIAALTNHLWQSTLFVIAAAALAFALRKNSAEVRHRIWFVASLKFLVPFSLLMSLGSLLSPSVPAPPANETIEPAPLSVAVDRFAQPFVDPSISAAAPRSSDSGGSETNWTALILTATWTCGFAVVVGVRARGWRRIRAALRHSVPVRIGEGNADLKVRATEELLEPGVVGIWRPVMLVPTTLEIQLTPRQLATVIAHELCHVRRRDNLTSALHMVVEAIFWFHPLVWIVGAKLIDERERACDEYVLRLCGEPQTYAESILSVCKLYVESPIACVSGVSGADLKRRVTAIMSNRVGLKLSVIRKAALTVAAMLALTLPIVAGMMTAPLRVSAFTQTPDTVQRFEVVSIKPCDDNSPPTNARQGGAGQASPGYLNLSCLTLRQLISRAYLSNPSDRLRNRKWEEQFVEGYSPFIRGGPSWVNTDKYTVEAKAESVTDQATLTGPMLRALLEDRFQVKTHRETEERTMLALTVAKTGLKIKPDAPDSCYELDTSHVRESSALKPPDKNFCGLATGDAWGSHRYIGVSLGDIPEGSRMDRFIDQLWRLMLQPIVDRTGLRGRYSFAIDFTPDENTPGVKGRCGGSPDCMARLAANGQPDDRPTTFPSNDTIFKALEKVGLKLESVKAPAEYLVIDRAERPNPDAPQPTPPQLAPRTSALNEKFDVVSIKPCPDVSVAQTGRGAGPNMAQTSAGHVYWACVTLASLVDQAYAGGDFPLLNRQDRPLAFEPMRGETRDDQKRVRGGPSWMYSDRFTIEATASLDVIGSVRGNLVRLPPAMNAALRAMLIERFQLQTRRATEDVPMYALSVANSGVKARLRAAGDCEEPPSVRPPGAEGRPTADGFFQGKWFCGAFSTAPLDMQRRLWAGEDLETLRSTSTVNRRYEYRGVSMHEVADQLAHAMDRWVLDKTGLAGEFLLAVEFASDDTTPRGGWFLTPDPVDYGGVRRPDTPTGNGSSIFKAFQALGLNLEPAKGPAEYLLIESVQKPKPNSPDARP